LTWLHMLGETCSFAAKDCSRPLGGEPLASSRSAYSWNSASALRLRVRVMFDTGCLRSATGSTPFSQGVDRGVKTLYSLAPLPDPGFVFCLRGFIVISLRIVRTHRPMTGRVAFARAAAMKSPGACGAALHLAYPLGWPSLFQATRLDGEEGRMHPGEGSAEPT
jgi:hypothetical protein